MFEGFFDGGDVFFGDVGGGGWGVVFGEISRVVYVSVAEEPVHGDAEGVRNF